MALLNSPELQALQPWASVIAASIAAMVAVMFGLTQVYIAWRQAKTAANKLKLDLFDRRWVVYKVATTAITSALSGSGLSPEEQHVYLSGIKGARWILDKETEKYLEETLWKMFSDYHLACRNLNDAGNREDRHALAVIQRNVYLKLFSQFQQIDKVFNRHLQLQS
ncbi:hypothetical protein [Delftia tsuruhatensis]|jgi:hypothetical protein|uniref:hypothetical protein n=1 Tax=Delftia tsuruhatensis TaxID=180282 RepID=UPI002028CE2E|nr:hypothetical protein [Delftia tsuruhatensis]